MATIGVRIPTMLRPAVGGEATVAAEGDDVGQVITGLIETYPGLGDYLADESGGIRKFVNLYVNDQDIRVLDKLATPLRDGDELSILPAVAGG